VFIRGERFIARKAESQAANHDIYKEQNGYPIGRVKGRGELPAASVDEETGGIVLELPWVYLSTLESTRIQDSKFHSIYVRLYRARTKTHKSHLNSHVDSCK
jgi:hypothetical protein